MIKRAILGLWTVFLLSGCSASSPHRATGETLERALSGVSKEVVKSFDGFALPVFVDLPENSDRSKVDRVVVFAHGSGPIDADGDLSDVSRESERPNLVYRDMATAIRKQGIATIRYNKRSFEVSERLKLDPSFAESEEYLAYAKDSLAYHMKDLKAVFAHAKTLFPTAKIFVLGHSEGSNLALWLVSQERSVAGVALVGFASETKSTLVFEQFVHRGFLIYFLSLDKNRDFKLDQRELNGKSELAKDLKRQLPMIDLNHDGSIDWTEFNGGNYSNVLTSGLHSQGNAIAEAKLPRISDVIEKANVPILILQGELDNQTPSYYAKGVELTNRLVWHKANLKFVYFEGKGHVLDDRSSYADLKYRRINQKAVARMASEINSFLK